ncbi:MAG: SWI/SNF complex component snf12 [Sclerophora amabilis]|nr:MAG: SWI/SNF complex component snf12 [Sclerophora amabilis]
MNTPMQSQYRGYPLAATQRSPHAAARRGPGPMLSNSHSQAAPTPAQLHQRQVADAQERELAKRRSRKPTDKNIPEGVEESVLGDGVQQYKDLRDLERRLDAAMMRKRLDIQDAVNRNVKRYKTLRVWISNSAENQPWQARGLDENAFDFSTGIEATYKVRIEGRLLDDEDDEDDISDEEEESEAKNHGEEDGDAMDHDGKDGASEKKKRSSKTIPPRKKLSHFFKSITIEFDRSKTLQPDATTHIEWKKPSVQPNTPNPPPAADFDSLEFERKSDENINITFNLVRDENPERFKLSKELAEVLDTEEEDRAGVVMGIWQYVKVMGLQEDEERRGIRCDDALRAIFKQDHVFFPQVPDLISQQQHLLPLPPLRLPYTIRVDPAFHSNPQSQPGTPPATNQTHRTPQPTIYDIRVPLDDPLRSRMGALMFSLNSSLNPSYTATLRNIASLDDSLAMTVQAIAHSRAKHGFFTAMSRDPAGFVKRWTSSQRRDLEVILGEATRGGGEEGVGQGEEWRRGGETGVWGTNDVKESVGLWLARAK